MADGHNLYGVLHGNPSLAVKGLVMVFNPTDKELQQEITLPLYYTGLSGDATVSERDGRGVKTKLDRQYRITLTPKVAPHSNTWFLIR